MSSVLTSDQLTTRLSEQPPKHGGDLAYWQRKVGDDALHWLDLSSACNREPWPIPAIEPECWMTLPDQMALLNTAEAYYGRRPNAVGAGSQHIIEALPLLIKESRRLKNGVVMVPRVGYQEHAFAWQKWGFELVHYDQFSELLEQEWAVAVVIQPNNPTSEWASDDELLSVLAYAEQKGTSLVIDEAFIDSQPERSVLRWKPEASLSEAVFVLRSVGKFFGLAGARVGFVFCAPHWQSLFQNVLGPWPVATPSLHLVSLALADRVWQAKASSSLAQRQAVFIERVVPKFNTIFDSQDRFVNDLFMTWFLSDQSYAEQVFGMLHSVGIHTRLGEGWIRVALPAMTEIDVLDKALIRLLKGTVGHTQSAGFTRGVLS